MTEEEKRLIDIYIPSPPDESLDKFVEEYYTKTASDKIVKGWLSDLAIDSFGNSIYRIRNNKGVVHSWASDNDGYMRMGHLYDNKQDCKDGTHDFYDNWEILREKQLKGL